MYFKAPISYIDDYLPQLCLLENSTNLSKRDIYLAFNDSRSISQSAHFEFKFKLNVYQMCANCKSKKDKNSLKYLYGELLQGYPKLINNLNGMDLHLQGLFTDKHYAIELLPYLSNNSNYCKSLCSCSIEGFYKSEKCLKLVYFVLKTKYHLFQSNSFSCLNVNDFNKTLIQQNLTEKDFFDSLSLLKSEQISNTVYLLPAEYSIKCPIHICREDPDKKFDLFWIIIAMLIAIIVIGILIGFIKYCYYLYGMFVFI